MTKADFLLSLKSQMSGMTDKDIDEQLSFYSEMVDDRIEEGLSEEEAVAAIGSIDQIANLINRDTPASNQSKSKTIDSKKKQRHPIRTALLILGSPLWLSLLIVLFAVVFILYICLWAIDICLWAAFAACFGCAIGGTASGCYFIFTGNIPSGIFMLAASIASAGFAILCFCISKLLGKGILKLTKWLLKRKRNHSAKGGNHHE